MIEIIPIDTPSLGDRSYIVTDGTVAAVVDPQRDIDRILAVVGERGLRVTHVADTHIHNDYVSGGLALARQTGAVYLVAADDPVAFERTPVRDGDIVAAGDMRLRVIHTPGHTFTHLAYALESPDGQTIGVFTGGSLLFGSTGRPDLLGADHAQTLARHQHTSAHRLASHLPGHAQLFPTHGFGSFCSATQSAGLASTIGQEMRSNPVLTEPAEPYVRTLLAGLAAYPAYYAHMAPTNLAGPAAPDLSPPSVADTAELRRRIDGGEWVVDLRERVAFAGGHMAGTLNFGFNTSFVTYLGWLIPWETPVTLLGETADQVASAQRDLARIGIDRPAAIAIGHPVDWSRGEALAAYRRVTFADIAAERRADREPFVLDVRRHDERTAGAVRGSTHVPLHDLLGRAAEMPADRPIWVHCASGFRASVAASLLARGGHTVVLIDDDFANVASADLTAAREAA